MDASHESTLLGWPKSVFGLLKTRTHFLANPVDAAAKLLQSCPTLCDPRQKPTRLPRPWDSPGKNTGVGCHFPLQCMRVKSESEVSQSCSTLGDPMDCSLPGSSIHGILQARTLEWGAAAFSEPSRYMAVISVFTSLTSSEIPFLSLHVASCSLGVCVLIPLILYRYRILDWDSVIQFNLIITCLYQHGLPRWLSGKESACVAGATGDTGSIPGSGRSPGGGRDNPLQYSCLENLMDGGAW